MPEQTVTPTTLVSDAARREVERITSAIPPGRRGTFELWGGKAGAEASVAWRLSDVWDTAAWAGISRSGAWDVGARLRAVW